MAVVDAHLHAFPTTEAGLAAQGGERRAGFDGTVDEIRSVLDRGRIDQAVVVSALPVAIWRRILGARRSGEELEQRVLELALQQNRGLCEACAADDCLLPALGAEAILPGKVMLDHLEELIGRYDVRALKIHPAMNFVFPHHPGYRPVFELAQRADLVVISHGGGAAEGLYDADVDFCAPEHFAPVLRDFPQLRLVVAHLAHPYVDDLVELAGEFRTSTPICPSSSAPTWSPGPGCGTACGPSGWSGCCSAATSPTSIPRPAWTACSVPGSPTARPG